MEKPGRVLPYCTLQDFVDLEQNVTAGQGRGVEESEEVEKNTKNAQKIPRP